MKDKSSVTLIIGNCVMCSTPLNSEGGCPNPVCNLYCLKPVTPNPQYGWICPRCNTVNAPYKQSCDCHGFATDFGGGDQTIIS